MASARVSDHNDGRCCKESETQIAVEGQDNEDNIYGETLVDRGKGKVK